jgi:hypothetical protein
MTNEQYEEYFEDLATRYAPIGHTAKKPRFARFNIEEVVTGLVHQLDLSKYCLLLEAPSGQLEDNGGDGYFDNQEIGFMIVRQVELRNFAEEKRVLSESRRQALQIVARILEEGRFSDLDENTIQYEKVGPIFGTLNCFGYRFSFTASDALELASEPDEWND